MKVAYLGTTQTRTQAPFNDPSWEIWCQNDPTGASRWDRWFEIHDIDDKAANPFWATIEQFLKSLDGSRPIYMGRKRPEIAGSVAYPRDRIVDRFGSQPLSCTPALAIALAIDEMVPRGQIARPGEHAIALYGVEMALKSEWEYQRPGCQHLLGIARALNIEVTLPQACDLLAPQLVYGLDKVSDLQKKIAEHKKFITERKTAAETQLSSYEVAVSQMRCAVAEFTGMQKMLDHAKDNGWGQDIPSAHQPAPRPLMRVVESSPHEVKEL